MNGLRIATLSVLSIVAVMTALVVILALSGYSPSAVGYAAWRGIASSPAKLAMSLQDVGPLLLCGLAASIAMRSGVLNIGGEGQFLCGSAICVGLATAWRPAGPGWLVIAVACLGGAVAGMLWALLASALERKRGVPVVLSTILLNFIAVFLVSWMVEIPLRDPATSAPQTAQMADDVRLPVLVAGSRLHLGIAMAVVVVIGVWLMERRTALGFALGVSGDNPEAAAAAGIPVQRCRLLAMGLGGACAGLAGAFQQVGITGFMSGSTQGYGYLGVAVALLGRLHPLGVAAAAVFFSLLDGAARGVEKGTDLPRDLADCIKGAVVLIVLMVTVWSVHRMQRTKTAP